MRATVIEVRPVGARLRVVYTCIHDGREYGPSVEHITAGKDAEARAQVLADSQAATILAQLEAPPPDEAAILREHVLSLSPDVVKQALKIDDAKMAEIASAKEAARGDDLRQ